MAEDEPYLRKEFRPMRRVTSTSVGFDSERQPNHGKGFVRVAREGFRSRVVEPFSGLSVCGRNAARRAAYSSRSFIVHVIYFSPHRIASSLSWAGHISKLMSHHSQCVIYNSTPKRLAKTPIARHRTPAYIVTDAVTSLRSHPSNRMLLNIEHAIECSHATTAAPARSSARPRPSGPTGTWAAGGFVIEFGGVCYQDTYPDVS